MKLAGVGNVLLLISSAGACAYVVSRAVDLWFDLPMRGSTIEQYEELHEERINLHAPLLLKRGFFVLLGTVVANSLLTLLIYLAGYLTEEPAQQFLRHFWLLTLLFGLPFSEILFLMDRRRLVSPIFVGCVVAGFFAIKNWVHLVARPLAGALGLAAMFVLGWMLQRYSLRKRDRL